MSLYPTLEGLKSAALPTTDRVEAWTVSQVADVLAASSISSPRFAEELQAHPSTVPLDIPLDERLHEAASPRPARPETFNTVYKRREPVRRDSQKRREALMKGKEGSRRRQRWENDRLLHNPHAQPPLPSDWEVHPTYLRQNVPYFLAPLWDAKFARSTQERQRKVDAAKMPADRDEAEALMVKRELRAKLKKSRGAKGLLEHLERQVRDFVKQWEEKQKQLEEEGLIDLDSEDDEIVFVGRDGAMSEVRRRDMQEEIFFKDKLIFQSLIDDHSASFGRYLVHCIATYYGLHSWSVSRDNPARREAYVGLKRDPRTRRPSIARVVIPQPLWAVV
ncbi:hypothetical protein M433DRAFT_143746 [Acidomyces richmondensis BFW]|nr:MAG: hypothetical protein FE78DRAFT_76009 [Acidomyces sp. 'richmondensis']KYG45674.1 hypothetical protein M433DRAFT_143746 [Acidomyces richmondensis BFW]